MRSSWACRRAASRARDSVSPAKAPLRAQRTPNSPSDRIRYRDPHPVHPSPVDLPVRADLRDLSDRRRGGSSLGRSGRGRLSRRRQVSLPCPIWWLMFQGTIRWKKRVRLASSQFSRRDLQPSVALATHARDVQVQRRVLFGRHRLVRVPDSPRQHVGARIGQDLLLRRPFREEVPVPQVVDLDVLNEQAGLAIAVAFTLVPDTVRASCASCAGRRRGRRCGTGRRRRRSSSGAFVLRGEASGDRGCIRAR